MNFEYSARTLNSNQLRLLIPVSYANEHALRFNISEVARDYAPSYTALSYTWGDGQPSEKIFLNGKIFYVSLNLWSCLYYLHLDGSSGRWTHIWVDAICINQNSVAEKNAQVRAMDETYRRAACVSVWLGLAPGAEQWSANMLEPIRIFDIEPFDWIDYMTDLANRPYWSRFWVIQEFLLNADVEIYCSGSRINWIDFKQFIGDETRTNLLANVNYIENDNATADSYAAIPLVTGRHPDKHPEFLRPLSELLVNHHRSKCKDPRDRVFALLGLIPDDERMLLQRLFPDYSLSEDHVATIALAHVLLFNENPEPVTVESDGLFLGLGVKQRASRRRLLKRAKDFDYIGCDGLGQFLSYIDVADSNEGYDTNKGCEAGDDSAPS